MCSVNYYHTLVPESSEDRKPIHNVYLNSGDKILDIPASNGMVVCTIAMVAKTRFGQLRIPSRWARFTFVDESQSGERGHLMCVSHIDC